MLRTILDTVVADPAQEHTLEAMAQRAGMSVRQLTRLFGKAVGVTPAQYVERVRVEAARMLLERSDERLDVIASRVGAYRGRLRIVNAFNHVRPQS